MTRFNQAPRWMTDRWIPATSESCPVLEELRAERVPVLEELDAARDALAEVQRRHAAEDVDAHEAARKAVRAGEPTDGPGADRHRRAAEVGLAEERASLATIALCDHLDRVLGVVTRDRRTELMDWVDEQRQRRPSGRYTAEASAVAGWVKGLDNDAMGAQAGFGGQVARWRRARASARTVLAEARGVERVAA